MKLQTFTNNMLQLSGAAIIGASIALARTVVVSQESFTITQ